MKILITDDHQLFLDGLQHILGQLDKTVDITQCTSADETIAVLETGQTFDLILVDLNMPHLGGMSILQRMHEKNIWLPLVVVSAEENIKSIQAALEIGAMGFIPKSHNSKQMLFALNEVLKGEIYVPKKIEREIKHLMTRRPHIEALSNMAVRESGITKRQLEVLRLMAKGHSNKDIATCLFLTEHTIKSHVSALFNALSAKNRTECVQSARKRSIITY